MPPTLITVPCYNEAERLAPDQVIRVLDHPDVGLVFVDDGSTDDTLRVLDALRVRSPGRIQVLSLEQNGGKAEAVRQGMLASLERGAGVVGYFDADLSTPPDEVLRLVEVLETSGAQVVLGSRIAILGAEIDRSTARHYLGRVFATVASLVLGELVYDTQCGAKLFRATPDLAEALAEPFQSRWAFDVELLGRLMASNRRRGRPGIEGIVEVPLRRWAEVGGSKLKVRHMARAGLDLLAIGGRLRRRD
jgi:dolichyl-phosphate beta-glucosyltransferase